MKVAITQTPDFPYGAHVTKIAGGWHIAWIKNDGDELEVFFEASITEELVRQHCGHREIGDCANIYFEIDPESPERIYIHNKMALTLFTKNNGFRHLRKSQRICLAQIYVPFSDSPSSEWLLRANVSANMKNELPVGYTSVPCTHEAFLAVAASTWPSIEVVSVKKLDEERVELAVQLTMVGEHIKRQGVRIFASAPIGYISKQEMATDANGQAKLIARRLDLSPEDGPMTVEFGFKFVKNVVNAKI